MKDVLILIFGTLATIGFSLVFNAKPKRLFWMTLAGFISTLIYIFTDELGTFACNVIAAFAITMYSEIFSRILKAPVITFLTPGVIPLVPGSTLYYTMSSILKKEYSLANTYALTTLDVCLGIATGILLASLLVSCFFYIKKHARVKKAQ